MILHSIELKLKILKPALRGTNVTPSSSRTVSVIDSIREGKDVMLTLEVAIAMCQRNSARHKDEQSERLWFTLMEKFLKVQNYVKRSNQNKSTTMSRAPQSAMQLALNEYIRIILERMASHIPLEKIMFKIITEHGRDDLGDFRHTIFSMLDTYKYEQNIYQTANILISTDMQEQGASLRREQGRSLAPSSIICSYCSVDLGKPPYGAGAASTISGEKWSRSSSSVMVLASGKLFHGTCGKIWQEENENKKTRTVRLNAVFFFKIFKLCCRKKVVFVERKLNQVNHWLKKRRKKHLVLP